MSWKQSTVIVTVVIASLIAMNLIWDFVVETKNNEGENQLPQFAPLYDNHLIRGRVYFSGNPVANGYVIYYHPKKANEILVDKQITNGYYEVNLANLPSGWHVGDEGILEINSKVNNQNLTIKKTIIVDNKPVQIENINVV